MIESIQTALKAEYGSTDYNRYRIDRIKAVNKNVAKVTITRIKAESFGVAASIEAARQYADRMIRRRLKNQTDTFDGEYLLKHIPGDFYDHLSECPTEAQKHERVKELGLDIESAVRDYRAGYAHHELSWIAGAVDSPHASAKTAGDVVYWYG